MTKIYESPDGGKTVYEREAGQDPADRICITEEDTISLDDFEFDIGDIYVGDSMDTTVSIDSGTTITLDDVTLSMPTWNIDGARVAGISIISNTVYNTSDVGIHILQKLANRRK